MESGLRQTGEFEAFPIGVGAMSRLVLSSRRINPLHSPKGTLTMVTNITPLGRRLLLKRAPSKDKSDGGIFLPDTAKEKPMEAEVLALGIGLNSEGKDVKYLISVQVGDKVIVANYGGSELTLHGEEVLIVNESDCLGIVS